MDEQTQARGPTAPFPEPPPFYKHFTKQNVSKLRELRKEAAKNRTEGTDEPEQGDIHVLSLPAELRFLVPPEPPSDGRYRSFGALHDLAQPSQSLESAGVPQLYPVEAPDSEHFDPTVHLTTLTRAVLCKFLELVGTMSVNPTQGPECVEDLQHMFYNINDLINRYRPHQARESLILMMEDQVEKIEADNARVKEVRDQKLAATLAEMKKLQQFSTNTSELALVHHTADSKSEVNALDKRKQAQRDMWNALDAEFGD